MDRRGYRWGQPMLSANLAILSDFKTMKYQSIYNRLRRIEGQIRGIEEMLNKDMADEEIFIQISAVRSSLNSTLVAFISDLLKTENDGKKIITAREIDLILRSIK